MKKNCLLFSIIIFPMLTCCAQQKIIKGEGNPDISNYINVEVKDYTISDDDFVYPSYEIWVEKKYDKEILEYEISYQFVFGQDWNVILDETRHYNVEDPELKKLNEDGFFLISINIEKLPIENEVNPSSYTGILNDRYLSVMDKYIRLKTR